MGPIFPSIHGCGARRSLSDRSTGDIDMRKALSVLTALTLAFSAGVALAHDGHAHGKEAIFGIVTQVHCDHL